MEIGGLVAEAAKRLGDAGLLTTVAGFGAARIDGAETVVVSIPQLAPRSTQRLVDEALAGLPHECVLVDRPGRDPAHPRLVSKDGRTWRVGGQADVDWINASTSPGLAITAAIPPRYDAYATVEIPDDDVRRPAGDSRLLELLTEQNPNGPWWLGYLDTGAHDVVFDDAPKVMVYTGWTYVLVEAGPAQAGAWRADDAWRGRLPELIFPADHSWLVSMLWDDDWRCLGGPTALIDAVLAEPDLDSHRVGLGPAATPPGHEAR